MYIRKQRSKIQQKEPKSPKLKIQDIRKEGAILDEAIVQKLIDLNDECTQHVGELDAAKIGYFCEHAKHFLVASAGKNTKEIYGFLIALSDGMRYAKPYYSWFLKFYPHFLFVDRIVVSPLYKRKEIGLNLIWKLMLESKMYHIPVLTAVNVVPKNPEGLGFFLNGLDCYLVGSEVISDDLDIAYFERQYTIEDLKFYLDKINRYPDTKLMKIIQTSLPKEIVEEMKSLKQSAHDHPHTNQKEYATENSL